MSVSKSIFGNVDDRLGICSPTALKHREYLPTSRLNESARSAKAIPEIPAESIAQSRTANIPAIALKIIEHIADTQQSL